MLTIAKEANSKIEGKSNRILKKPMCTIQSGEESKTLMTEHYQRKISGFHV